MRRLLFFLFWISLVAAVGLAWSFKNLWLIPIVIFPAHAAILLGCLIPKAQWICPVVTEFKTDAREVWLTIDDGPSGSETTAVLEVLDRFNWRATFFLIGKKCDREICARISGKGHQIGNHTFNHPSGTFWAFPEFAVQQEISRMKPFQTVPFFRCPAGMKPISLSKVMKREKMIPICWTARGFDGVSSDIEKIQSRLIKNIRPGAIILLHEGLGHAPELLEWLLPWLEENGYRCVLPDPAQFSRFSIKQGLIDDQTGSDRDAHLRCESH